MGNGCGLGRYDAGSIYTGTTGKRAEDIKGYIREKGGKMNGLAWGMTIASGLTFTLENATIWAAGKPRTIEDWSNRSTYLFVIDSRVGDC